MHRTLAVVLFALVACGKKDDKPVEPEASKATKVAEPAAKPEPAKPEPAKPEPAKPEPVKSDTSASCPAGAFASTLADHPKFCLALPKDYTLKNGKPEKSSHHEWRYQFTGPGDYRPELSVTVH